MLKIAVAGCLIFGLALSLQAQAENKTSGVINFQGDTVHLELSGQQNWDYDMKRNENKGKTVVEMTVPALDDASVQSLNSFKSEMVSQVSVDRKGPDGKYIISFTLSGADIDSFDYLTDQPSRLIVDFYLNPHAAKPKPVVQKNETKSEVASAKSAKQVVKNKTDRKPATADVLTIANQGASVSLSEESARKGIFDGGDPDYDRFTVKPYDIKEESIIRAKDNYYIAFPMLEIPMS
ncbi:MAG TPA: hypothetical protein VN132_09745, partial [Bdellovibrio sp.]|nr:hypothetical protein [Bdellovibrio sp.]